ncbi:tRNA pseudouridine38/39 synthase [Nematocida sp. AWRm77]|nr:tRNA pseudouridine38/39 synthase [Nematocida sp. AWRm77]
MGSNVLFKLSYNGKEYHGFAYQPGLPTVEYWLFVALLKGKLIKAENTVKQPFAVSKSVHDALSLANYHKCGRTDTGVSAAAQYISLCVSLLSSSGAAPPYDRILNAYLPESIRVLGWMRVPDTFSARFSCEWREYEYYFVKNALDVERMQEASKELLGTHWFGRLSKTEKPASKQKRMEKKQKVSPDMSVLEEGVRTVDRISFSRHKDIPELGIQVFVMRIKAKSFLHNQVRKIFSLLGMVGSGQDISIQAVLDKEAPHCLSIPLASPYFLVLSACSFQGISLSEMCTSLGKQPSLKAKLDSSLILSEVEVRLGQEMFK